MAKQRVEKLNHEYIGKNILFDIQDQESANERPLGVVYRTILKKIWLERSFVSCFLARWLWQSPQLKEEGW